MSPGEEALKSRSIAYVMTDNQWAVYQTAGGKDECPQGLSKWGPRERFKAMFPPGQRRQVHPQPDPDRAGRLDLEPEPQARTISIISKQAGKVSCRMNLDGKIGPKDFTSPDGEKGVDNQLFRVIGCDDNMRGPTGTIYGVGGKLCPQRHLQPDDRSNSTNVDNLVNDADVDVTVTTHAGSTRLMADAGGDRYVPGGSQRIDTRWGEKIHPAFPWQDREWRAHNRRRCPCSR